MIDKAITVEKIKNRFNYESNVNIDNDTIQSFTKIGLVDKFKQKSNNAMELFERKFYDNKHKLSASALSSGIEQVIPSLIRQSGLQLEQAVLERKLKIHSFISKEGRDEMPPRALSLKEHMGAEDFLDYKVLNNPIVTNIESTSVAFQKRRSDREIEHLNFTKSSALEAQNHTGTLNKVADIYTIETLDLFTDSVSTEFHLEKENLERMAYGRTGSEATLSNAIEGLIDQKLVSLFYGNGTSKYFNSTGVVSAGASNGTGNNIFDNLAASTDIENYTNAQMQTFLKQLQILLDNHHIYSTEFLMCVPVSYYRMLQRQTRSDLNGYRVSSLDMIEKACSNLTVVPVTLLGNDNAIDNRNSKYGNNQNNMVIMPKPGKNAIIEIETIPFSQLLTYSIHPQRAITEYIAQTTGPQIIIPELIYSYTL